MANKIYRNYVYFSVSVCVSVLAILFTNFHNGKKFDQ